MVQLMRGICPLLQDRKQEMDNLYTKADSMKTRIGKRA